MTKVIDYVILTGTSTITLQERVMDYLACGYVPLGSPYVSTENIHYQALIKYDEPQG